MSKMAAAGRYTLGEVQIEILPPWQVSLYVMRAESLVPTPSGPRIWEKKYFNT